MPIINGTSGDDRLTGSREADEISGLEGNDWIDALGGADILSGGAGDDTIDAGDGDDRIDAGTGYDTVNGGLGIDAVSADFTALGSRTKGFGVSIDLNDAESIGTFGSWTGVEYFRTIIGTGYADTLVTRVPDAGWYWQTALHVGGGDDHVTATAGTTGAWLYVDGGAGFDTVALDYSAAIRGLESYVSPSGVESYIRVNLGRSFYYSNVERLVVTGSPFADAIYTGTGNDEIDGGQGDDDLRGGSGNDLYFIDSAGDAITEAAAAGDADEVRTALAVYTLAAEVEILRGTSASAQTLTGNASNNIIQGSLGNDALSGGLGDDIFQSSGGIDSMAGGGGNDLYLVEGVLHTVVEASGEGTDEVRTSRSEYTLGTHVENLTGISAAGQALTGNDLANVITGGTGSDSLDGLDGNDTLIGGGGADFLRGGVGHDIYVIDSLDDAAVENSGEGTDHVQTTLAQYTLGDHLEDLTGTAATGQALTGNAIGNRLFGGIGDDTLDGAAGADRLAGGMGNDIYVVDNLSDFAVEAAGEGYDTVQSSVTFSLAAELERLVLTGEAAVNATGNALANQLYGNAGNNRIDGGLGADRMSGGAGDDTYVVDEAGDRVLESSATGGIDTVYSGISFSLAYQYLEKLFLTGTALDATGNSLANTLVGTSANNVLDGMGGVDVMNGGAGDDTYVVDQTGDTVIESTGGGTDHVLSSATFALSRNYEIENLTLTGYNAVNAYGNHLANTLTGNDNNNVLNGSTGADTMAGKGNNDIYYVDDAGDVVIEEAGGAVDTIHSAVSYVLPDHVENIGLMGSASLDLTGNGLSNRIYGNAGDNVLDGGAGADYLTGRGGNDTYVVDNIGDRVLENDPNGGDADKIRASVSYGLGGIYVETLELTGTAAIDATGNSLANTLVGNSGANNLYGKSGNDSLTGGAGADGFYFDTALSASGNVDAILDFSVADDTIFLRRGVFSGIAADGTLASGAFAQGTAAQDADDRIVYDSATGNIWYDADGSGAGAAVLFATVAAGTALTHLDFTAYTPA